MSRRTFYGLTLAMVIGMLVGTVAGLLEIIRGLVCDEYPGPRVTARDLEHWPVIGEPR